MSIVRAIWLAIQSIRPAPKYALISEILSETWRPFGSNPEPLSTSVKRTTLSSPRTYQITGSHTLSTLGSSPVQQKRNDARKEQDKRVRKRREHNELRSEGKQSQGAERERLERTLPFSACPLLRTAVFYAPFASKTTLTSWDSVVTISAESVSRSEELWAWAVRCAEDRWRNQFVFLPDTEKGWEDCRPLHDYLTSDRHVQCCCFDSTSSVVFLGVSFNADKLYWTLWVKHLHDHPFAFLWLSKQNIHAILWISPAHMVFYPCSSCAISVCSGKKLWASIPYCDVSEGEIVHPRHNLPYHWGSWHTPSFVRGWVRRGDYCGSALFDRELRWLNQIQKRPFLIPEFLSHEPMHSGQWSQNEDSARTQTGITQMNNGSLTVCLPDLYFSNLYLKRAMKLWLLSCTNIPGYSTKIAR